MAMRRVVSRAATATADDDRVNSRLKGANSDEHVPQPDDFER
jgi:hypothetical protein